MRLGNALAIVLATSLLCVSSWASACELSCSLAHSYPLSESAGATSAAQATEIASFGMNAPHSHCGHAKTAGPSNSATPHFESASNCAGAPCAQVQALSSPVNGRDVAELKGVHFAVLASVPAGASNSLFRSYKRDCAPINLLPLDPLSVGLRI